MHYPANYGFVPKTLWDDGDPLDVLVLSHEPFVPGALVDARPIGVLNMTDDGESDAKILAVPAKDPRFKNISDISNIEPHILEEIQHFFKVYKDLQEKEVVVGAWEAREKAFEAVDHSLKLYNEKYGN
jgi:inorganic pyrophosphatase